ncbi:hypothetical protein J3R82DRAFT_10577 [Butyriboletus roseoflavus]|nr:hypothetical protein J3R82DRAFT_10577 [Butyriboletus roseoflavus]
MFVSPISQMLSLLHRELQNPNMALSCFIPRPTPPPSIPPNPHTLTALPTTSPYALLWRPDLPLGVHLAEAPVTITSWPVREAIILPIFEIDRAFFKEELHKLCPDDTDIQALISKNAGQSFLSNCVQDNKYVMAHRGFQDAFPGKGVLPEQSQPGLNAPYECGVRTVKLDLTYLAGLPHDHTEIVAHDFSINHLFAKVTGAFRDQIWSQFKNLRIVFKLVNN